MVFFYLRYWAEEGTKAYGNILVECKEKRYNNKQSFVNDLVLKYLMFLFQSLLKFSQRIQKENIQINKH